MEEFYYDTQTLKDLELFKDPRDRSPSIFSLFNRCLTPGGSTKLKEIMMAPSSDIEYLRKRTTMIRYLQENQLKLELRSHQVESIKKYLELNVALLKSNIFDRWNKIVTEWYMPTNEYYLIETGLRQIFKVLEEIYKQIDFEDENLPPLLKEETQQISKLYPILKKACPRRMTRSRLAGKMDKLCRKKHKDDLLEMIEEIHRLDAYLAVAQAGLTCEFHPPEFLNQEMPYFSFQNLRHPLLPDAKSYNFSLGESSNMCFLTGPNMAGKSTFLKAVSISMYLAHLGFPVPATNSRLGLFRGMSTTINLSDNLGLGYSHYFAEVNRVNEVVDLLQKHQPMFIVFDELFRGTNVKDAREASTTIIGAFSKLPRSSFLVSTHIVEVAEDLKGTESVSFNRFGVQWENGNPSYNYEIKEGVSTDSLGMYILKKEGILDKLSKLVQ